MSGSEKEPFPPSYTLSHTAATPPSRRQSLLDQVTVTRAQHIQSTIQTHLIPLVEQQARHGIAHTTIAMLPSDIPLLPRAEQSEFSFDTPATKPVEVIGFSSEAAPKVVRLEGQMNRTEFWRPQAVVEELERVLRQTLNAASSSLRSPSSPVRVGREDGGAGASRTGFLTRLVGSMGPPEQKAGSESRPEGATRQAERLGLVLVKVRLEEICLRTVTEFGLYDTMSKQCVIIRVDARC